MSSKTVEHLGLLEAESKGSLEMLMFFFFFVK